MILIFNKQFRQEEKLIALLAKKLKKSESMTREYGKPGTNEGNTEIYRLDDIDLYLDLGVKSGAGSITVKDKQGVVIYKMDCHYDQYNQMQDARADWFHELLMMARDVYQKKAEKAKKYQEEKLIALLAKKVKKSESMTREYGKAGTDEGNTEIYRLDDIDLYLDLGVKGGASSITVKDKQGGVIYKIDCHYDPNNQMQDARADWFHNLLMKAREVYEKRVEKAKKYTEATAKVNEKRQAKQSLNATEQQRDAAIKEALSKLR